MRRLWISALAALALAGTTLGQREDDRPDPEQLFKAACEDETEIDERLRALGHLAKLYPRSKWADDAVWLMGEMCAQAKRRKEAIEYKTRLTKRYPNCRLQAYTKNLKVYKKSFIPTLGSLFRSMGHVKFKSRRKFAFTNPVPIAVNHDLAVMYERQGNYVESKRYYRACLRRMPAEGALTKFIRKNYDRVREKAEIQQWLQKGADREPAPKK